MANIIIGYKNLCLESGVTFTPSTEHADHDADNLGKAHPESFWRMTSPLRQTLTVTLPAPYLFNLVAPLYLTSSGHQNALQNTRDFNNADWSTTGLAGTFSTEGGFLFAGGEPLIPWDIKEDTSTGTHLIDQATIEKPKSATAFQVGVELYMLVGGISFNPTRRVKIGIFKGSNNASAIFDPQAGTHISSSTAGDYHGTVDAEIATVTGHTVFGTVYRLRMVCQTGTADDDFTVRLQFLNGASSSYTGSASEGGVFMAPKCIYTDHGVFDTDEISSDIFLTGDDRSAVWRNGAFVDDAIGQDQITNEMYHITRRGDAQDFVASRGHVHTYSYREAGVGETSVAMEFHDATDGKSVLDLSNVYVGPSWQPTQNLVAMSINPTGNREFQIDLGFQTWEDAMGEAHAMGIKQSRYQAIGRSYGGAEYQAEMSPVLVIVDADEDQFSQELMIYGRVTSFSLDRAGWFQDRGDGTAGTRPRVSFTIRELLPG